MQSAKFFDSTVRVLMTYPVTMVRLLAFPKKVVGKHPDNLTCPASVALVISFLCNWLAKLALHNIEYPNFGIIWPTTLQMGTRLVLAAALIAFMTLVVRQILRLRSEVGDPLADIPALTYPVSVGLLANSLLIFLAINFPQVTMWLAPRDTLYEELIIEGGLPVIFPERARVLAALAALPVFAWSLFNVLRIRFAATASKAALGVVVIFVAMGLALILLIGIGIATLTSIEQLGRTDQVAP